MDTEYYKVRNKWKEIYDTFTPVHSTALGIEVTFNSQGFMHIVYEKGNVERDRATQKKRFELLQKAYDLVKLANIYQEHDFDVQKNVYYWGIIAIINNNKIKVVLRRNGKNGKVVFWSVIPSWVTNIKRDTRFTSN